MAEINVTLVEESPEFQVEIIASGPAGPRGPQGPQGPQGIQGIQGVQGPAGQDGADGAPGQDGADGQDGVSPTISSEAITGGHRLTIVDAGGTTTVDVMDGQDGAPGQDGADGAPGADGKDGADGAPGADGTDGVSPEVTIASITGGHSVTITDADHPTGQTFNVMDGQDGANGTDGAKGDKGDKGDTGPQGPKGDTGPQGPQGPQGPAYTVEEIPVSTSGAVTQALDAGKIYHFTGALTALTVTATDPTTGKYQFDFISGSTVPTLTVPASWVMPDNFLVEPSARYSLTVENGYCSLKKWSNSHSPFIYLDSTAGDFVMNGSGITSDGKVYANVGSEVIAVSIDGKLKNQLANNSWLKICDISANAKALMGSTYVSSYIAVGSGKITQCAFNTWDTSSEIKVKNNTGAALAADTQLVGTIFILRTL